MDSESKQKIYKLILNNNCYYIGKTYKNLVERLREHKTDIKSNKFVQLNGIITIEKIRDMDNNPDHKFLEDLEVKKNMETYGIDNVRGGSYTDLILNDATRELLLNEIDNANNKCRVCGQNGCFSSQCLGNFFKPPGIINENLEGLTIDSLTSEQRVVYDRIIEGKSLCIIGEGGTGKSYLGKCVFKLLGKRILQVAMTGKAAQQLILPKTLHSLFGLNIYSTEFSENPKNFLKRLENSLKWQQIIDYLSACNGILWIDEVFGLSAENFYTLCQAIKRTNKKDKKPLRGIQLILVGDPAQIKPIGKKKDPYTEMCFQSDSWDLYIKNNIYKLQKNVRAKKDTEFSEHLKSTRLGLMDCNPEKKIAILQRINKQRITKKDYSDIFKFSEKDYKSIVVTPFNDDRNAINQNNLTKISEKNGSTVFEYIRKFKSKPDIKLSDKIKSEFDKNSSYDVKFRYCKGSSVMLKKNLELQNGLSNGTIGTIIDITGPTDKQILKIKFENGLIRDISPEIHQHCEHLNVQAIAYPLISGPAITLHSVQGSTIKGKLIFNMNALDKVGTPYWLLPHLVRRKEWIEQQFYVAMSRCTSYTNFWIYSDEIITEKHITINEDVYDFLIDCE